MSPLSQGIQSCSGEVAQRSWAPRSGVVVGPSWAGQESRREGTDAGRPHGRDPEPRSRILKLSSIFYKV